MKKRQILSLFAALALCVQGAVAQVVTTDRPTAQQLFDRCGALCDPMAVTTTVSKNGIHAAQAEPGAPVAMLRVVGGQIVGMSAKVYMDVTRDLPEEVWVAGRVVSIIDGRPVPDKAFYVGKDLSLTRFGPGLFPSLASGAVIPLGEVSVGNAGDEALLQLVFYDSRSGGREIQTISTRIWSKIRPTRGMPSRVVVNSTEIMADRVTLRLTGRFPKGERLVVEVGDPEWDSGFATAVSDSGTVLTLRIPQGKTGGALYPNNWDGEVAWTIVIATSDGESSTFPGPRVRGDFNRSGIFPAQ